MPGIRTFAAKTVLLGLALVLLPACASNDKFRFESTVDRPTTIKVVQAMADGHVLWEMDIPVQHALTINLTRSGEFDYFSVNPNKPATQFHWALFDDYGKRLDWGTEDLPGLPIRLEMALREAPEWPADYTPPQRVQDPAVEEPAREPRAPSEIEEPAEDVAPSEVEEPAQDIEDEDAGEEDGADDGAAAPSDAE